jgi:hypothetical protein
MAEENKPVVYKHGDLSINEDQLKNLMDENGMIAVPKELLQKLLHKSKMESEENEKFKNSVTNLMLGVEKLREDFQIDKIADNPMKIPGLLLKLKKKFKDPSKIEQEFSYILKPIMDIADICNIENKLTFDKKNTNGRLIEPAKKSN